MIKKLAFGGLGLILLTSPLLVSAYSVSDLQAQIQSLLAQITQLKAQMNVGLGHGAQTSPRYCDTPLANNLMIGSTDARTNGEVTKLQQFLRDQGYTDAQITGYYGNITAGLVMRWQKAHGMDFVTLKSGVGPMTRAKINANCGVFSPGSQNSETASWKTYTNAQYGFSFKYPSDWYLDSSGPAVVVTSYNPYPGHGGALGGDNIKIYIDNTYVVASGETLESWVNKFDLTNKQNISVAGIPAIRGKAHKGFNENDKSYGGDVRLIYKNKGYQIGYVPYESNFVNVFDTILSTIKFF